MSVSKPRLALGAAAALALAGAAVVAAAQTPPAPPAAPGAPVIRQDRQVIIRRDNGPGPGRFVGRQDRNGPGRVAAPADRAERLRTILQLTAGQENALQAFLAATAPPALPAAPQAASNTPPTAVERADRAAELTARVAAEARKRADATRTFYAALTPSQRKVFDTAGRGGGRQMIRIRQMRGPGAPPMPGMPPAPPVPGRRG